MMGPADVHGDTLRQASGVRRRPSTASVALGGLLGAVLLAAPAFAAGDCRAASGPIRGTLVELYTSEGCSSCPPAERWLARLPAAAIASGRLVPVAFHVSYWDRLGWRDPYARPAFTERQRAQQALDRAAYVYTPQVVADGRDRRDWHRTGFAGELTSDRGPPLADLSIRLASDADGVTAVADATLRPGAPRDGIELFVAIVESGLVSKVTAGENRGETLSHAHVARAWSGGVPIAQASGRGTATASLRPTPGATPGAVAFVQARASGRVLQAMALPGCPR
jgi:hypothetical protein